MQKKRVVLADKDTHLMKLLMVKLLSEQYEKFDVELLTDPAYMQVFFAEPQQIDLLVMGIEEFEQQYLPGYTARSLILMADNGSRMSDGGYLVRERRGDFNKLFYAVLNSAEHAGSQQNEQKSQSIRPDREMTGRLDEQSAVKKRGAAPEQAPEDDTEIPSHHIVLLTDTGSMEKMVLPGTMEGIFWFSEHSLPGREFHVYMSRGTGILVLGEGARLVQSISQEETETEYLPQGTYGLPGSIQPNAHRVKPAAMPVVQDTTNEAQGVQDKFPELRKNRLLQVLAGGRQYTLYTEIQKRSDSIFHNYRIRENTRVSIGNGSINALFYDCPYISKQHAEIEYRGGVFQIRDLNSTNGTYVNGNRISEYSLKLGDVIFMMGLQIIVGNGYLAVNDFHKGVFLDSEVFSLVHDPSDLAGKQEPFHRAPFLESYDRKPRKRRYVPEETIEVDAPPMPASNSGLPLVLRMGGSAVTSARTALMGNYSMLLTSLLFPFLSHRYTEKQRQEYEQKRVQYYTAYLDSKQNEIYTEIKTEQDALRENYPETQQLLKQILNGKSLWERRVTDDDFLLLRIGSGSIPMRAKINYPREKINLEEDQLELRMRQMAATSYELQNVPIQVSLMDDYVLGIAGPSDQRMAFMKLLIMNLVLLHSYDDVKTIFLLDKEQLQQFDFLRFLPHVWDKQRNLRYIASNPSESVRIGEALRAELALDLERSAQLSGMLKRRPYYVVFAFDQKQYESLEILKDILLEDKNMGVSVVSACRNLPKECSKIIYVDTLTNNRVIQIKDIDTADVFFSRDVYLESVAGQAMRKVANISVRNEKAAFTLPKMVTFLEMFGVGRIEYLNPIKRWQSSTPEKTLAAPVGVGTDGSIFTLDLHEKAQGPHGLVAGMTGSGKSEFIITYILSMAVSYHPDEVAFVLIDYKGGGLAGAFDDPSRGIHLPHLIGTITNLDGAGIRRSLISLQSELLRRQRVFNEAKSIANEGTMDIYDYQKMYRKGILKEPMPHLFIISDEFAELKAQKPEFMDQLISIARIGRSLGVHLILATQKPSGVVNAQILSNTKFRVCLKVQDRSDSQDMLQRPDAAELKDTGRFYLQVGYNEYFAMGQSAWSGADYEPQDEIVVKKDESLQALDLTGQLIASAQPLAKKDSGGTSQLVSVVKYLSDLATLEGFKSKTLWLPALEKAIAYEQVQHTYDASVPYRISLGMLDDPENQHQYLWQEDLMDVRNLWIAGQMESGKSTLLETILLTASEHLAPEDLQYYVLTYSGRQFPLFTVLPHCGAVLGEEDIEDLERFFRLLDDIIQERKELYRKYEFSSFETCRQQLRIPMILVVIDNIKVLRDSKAGAKYYDMLSDYLKNGILYGIRFIITSSALGDLIGRLKAEIGDRIALQLRDRFDVGELLGTKVKDIPAECPGRGMALFDGRPLEYQAVMFRPELEGKERMDALRVFIREIADKYQENVRARAFDRIEEEEEYTDFMQRFERQRLPIGYSLLTAKPVVLPMKQFSMLKVYFGNTDSTVPITRNLMQWALAEEMDILLLTRKEDSVFESDPALMAYTAGSEGTAITRLTMSADDTDRSWNILTEEILRRKEILTGYCTQNGLDQKDQNIAQLTWAFMSSHTKPYLIFCERFYDYCMAMSKTGTEVMPTVLSLLRQYNMYLVGGFYPGDGDRLTTNAVMQSFAKEEYVLMYGGSLDNQGLVKLPMEYARNKEAFPYNKCLMDYRGKLQPILTPCGKQEEEAQEEDDRDIF